ncbi:LOW QUALITY PROTEIN: translational activator of cytochrome c oxidase 1 [Patagioenas fasciata]|uniref:LOW QUALITY PROTEIN: translational activator of cytochrome c oxidase 1 n=1 Tax=Patagioenas fasciata TaxID=372321 RepID=UPI0032E89E38
MAVSLWRWPRLVAAGWPGWPWAPWRGAGHNRWSKVRNVKGPRDAQRSRTFQRLAMLLRSAAREGGPDPALNAQLANVVEQCRANNMPKATIAAAIQSAERPSPDTRLLCEARGPGGAAILLEIVTDDPRRSQRDVRLLLAQHGWVPAADPGVREGPGRPGLRARPPAHRGALWEAPRGGFEEKGVVRVAPGDAQGRPLSLEGALETALDVGATDVEEDDEGAGLKFLCPPGAVAAVARALEGAGLRPLEAAVEFVPRARAALPGGAGERARRLLEALAGHPDVARCYHNIQWEAAAAPRPQ